MPWPGAPKSASSPPINPPSQRFPFTLNDQSSMSDVAAAMRTVFNGLTVHEQAFASLPDQIATQASAAATQVVQNISSENVSEVVSHFNTLTGDVLYFPGLGSVNDQLGQTAYSPSQADAGAKIIVGDSSPVIVSLSSSLAAPWFCIIDNDSSATVSLTGTVEGATSIYPGGFAIIFYDGTKFWAGSTPAPVVGLTTTITTAKLSVANGSMTFVNGILTASTPAT